ncbi:MAG TPA: hypothetical protein DIW86_17330 [Pseudomonas sp.]|nr:hypothetical protein [Pseudomonas sp.]
MHIPKCGSGLAREGGVSVSDFLSDIPLSRASPLPQGIVSYLQSCATCSRRDGVMVDASGLRSYRNTLVPSWDL